MGNYNAHSPQILGEEWVPIRDEQLEFSPAVNAYEQGVGFTFNQTRQIQDARFYINDPPVFFGQTFLAAIYAAGTEDQSGPISSLIIPCNGGAITGAATEVVLSGASTVAEAVASEGDGKSIVFANSVANASANVSFFFNINAYPVLQGKRILGLRLRYLTSGYFVNQTSGWDSGSDIALGQLFNAITIVDDLGRGAGFNGLSSDEITFTTGGRVKTLSFGEVNHNWSTSSPQATSDRMPWRYLELQRLQTSAANRLHVHMYTQSPQGAGTALGTLSYLALEVIYCEEKRLVYGGRTFGANSFAGVFNTEPYIYQTNTLPMRDTSFNTNPILAAGDYIATLSSPDQGEFTGSASVVAASGIFRNRTQYPTPFALRELYTTPPHPGSIINIPFPVEEHLGDEFSTVSTHVLPQLSLHASGGTLTEPHVYGRQVAAQVYGVNTATQDIYDDISGVNAVYPQVRYYARRFGDTTIPLTLTGVGAFSGSSASITVADFDALAEIIDGWKEVTLRFGAAPTMGAVAGFPAWTWSATSETAGNRWEILGASAPAISGIPGNLYNQVTAIHQLSSATYQPTGGATAELTWMPQGIGSPYVTGATADATSDAVLIFSQDPPTVTGVSLTARTQTVTGIGFDCGSLPCCIPSGIAYQQIQWGATSLTSPAPDILDTFSRVAANGFGTADSGQAWVNTLVSAGTDAQISVNGATGLHTPLGIPLAIVNTIGANVSDSDAYMTYSTSAATASAEVSILARFSDTNNYYRVVHNIFTNALVIQKVVAGVTTALASGTGAGTTTSALRVRFRVVGTTLLAKSWLASDVEPAAWTLSATDNALASGVAGLLTYQDTASKTFSFDNFQVTNLSVGSFGAYELQRWDSVTGGDFETIMLATNPALLSFNDYEARVGITSVYRIRSLNALNFAGSWSTYVSGAPPTPGVTGGCPDMTGALIFTSNSAQSGIHNAAYVMQWDRDPAEDFGLPEAGEVQFQPAYGRDGAVAFHGTERGLETFSRTVLLQAAAISPERLADAKTIRDLAWADLPYVCVRDDIGDRWFANVRVPSVVVRHNRTKYMARLEIVETNVCPYPVNP